MAKQLKLRRGTTSQHSSFTGAEGEVTVDTDKETLVVHDGSTAGGHPVAAEDMANVSSANIAGRLANDSIATSKIAAGALPSDVSIDTANVSTNAIVNSKIADGQINSAKLVDGTIVNVDVSNSAAIAGTKISPDFGSQNITTTGSATISGELIVNGNTTSKIHLQDSNHNPDYEISNADGVLRFRDTTNATNRIMVNTDGHIDLKSNVDCEAGIDVTGNANIGSDLTVSGGDITINGTVPALHFNDTDNESDYQIRNNNGTFQILDVDQGGGTVFFQRETNADCTFTGNVNVTNGVDVTGNITVSGTVDGVDVANLKTAKDSLSTSNGVILNGVTATTQSAGDNSTKVATTAYTDTAISNLVDSSPSALNTLNELAAAINDDANFATTMTNNLATKMPKAGGEFTGNITVENIFPDADSSRSLGTSGNRFSNIYADNLYGGGANITGIPAANLTGTAAAINGSNITNLSAANLTGTLPAIDGSNLTGIVSFVSGMIILWSGSTSNIPSGWVLCNGSNSTPDLRDRFVIGAGNSYSVGATGGSTTDSVNVTVSGTTGNNSGSNIRVAFGNQNWHPYAAPQNHNHSFSGSGSDTVSTMSPYYALCYIMKT